MHYILAHAGEVHNTATEAAGHRLSSWYIALPLFLLSVIGLAAIVQLVFRKTLTTLAMIAAVLLIVGFTTYNISAVVSVVSITSGLMISMLLAFVSLLSPKAAPVKAGKDE